MKSISKSRIPPMTKRNLTTMFGINCKYKFAYKFVLASKGLLSCIQFTDNTDFKIGPKLRDKGYEWYEIVDKELDNKFNCDSCEIYYDNNVKNDTVVNRCCPFCAAVLPTIPRFIDLSFTVIKPKSPIQKLKDLVQSIDRHTAVNKNTVVNINYEEAKILLLEMDRLKSREKLLNALEGCGVDNWDGFDDAIEQYKATP